MKKIYDSPGKRERRKKEERGYGRQSGRGKRRKVFQGKKGGVLLVCVTGETKEKKGTISYVEEREERNPPAFPSSSEGRRFESKPSEEETLKKKRGKRYSPHGRLGQFHSPKKKEKKKATKSTPPSGKGRERISYHPESRFGAMRRKEKRAGEEKRRREGVLPPLH